MSFFATLSGQFKAAFSKRPLLANMATTGLLFGTGDLVAQTIAKASASDSQPDPASTLQASDSHQDERLLFDFSRTSKAVAYGFFFFAPFGTKYYPALEKIRIPRRFYSSTPQSANPGKAEQLLTQVVPRVVFDQLAFSPCACAFYYIVMGVFEGMTSWDQIKTTKLDPNWWPTFKTNLYVWPLFQVANFSLVPVQYRLFSVNVVSVGWNAFISYRNTHHSKTVHA